MIFDIEKALKTSDLTKAQIEKIKQYCRKEFKDDDMMYELHVIRAIHALKKGYFDL